MQYAKLLQLIKVLYIYISNRMDLMMLNMNFAIKVEFVFIDLVV
jgi:hypothetical protein